MTPPPWRPTLARRMTTVVVLLALWVAGIETRLIYLQVISHGDLVARAERQQKRTQDMLAKRGDILDRRGRVLATSVDADSIYAVPTEIADAPDAVAKLCRAFGDCTKKERQALVDKLNQERAFTYVRRQVAPDVAERVAALNLDGVGFLKESKRFYPNRELASHILGWVGIDNTGLSGLEYTYDPHIRGKKGTILIQTDARRHAFSHVDRPPTAGSTIELTIDSNLQHIAERELHAGVLENHAVGGTAIVMDPRTGEILAMANEPTFNPNAFREADETARRNRAVQDLYEPGSTFKVVTASAAIEEKIMPVDTPIDVSGGLIRIGPRVVHDTHNYGVLSFTDVIVKSSNVGAIKIGFRLGTNLLSDYVQRFGFGKRVSSDFPSENPGIVWDRAKWTESALASVSMGYQVGVTPLQMAAAVSSVANGGDYIEPRVVRAFYRNERRLAVSAKVTRRTITADTAAALTTIMEQVVERGTAKPAQIPGYTIAGKTGTANKLVNGHYSSDTYASFVGFIPSRNPALTVIVVLDAPHGNNGHFGGPVSAPIFRRIAEASLRYLGVPQNVNPAPAVLVAKHEDTIEEPEPRVTFVTNDAAGTVPDVRGMSAREAIRTLFRAGLNAHVSGDGLVVAQVPVAGTAIETGTVCRLSLERAPAVRRASDQVHQ